MTITMNLTLMLIPSLRHSRCTASRAVGGVRSSVAAPPANPPIGGRRPRISESLSESVDPGIPPPQDEESAQVKASEIPDPRWTRRKDARKPSLCTAAIVHSFSSASSMIYIYIYIYREREREIYIYIYTYIHL